MLHIMGGCCLSWDEVGQYIKGNLESGVSLIGSLLMGNVPSAIANGISLVTSATGYDNPSQVIDALKSDKQTHARLRELYYANAADIRKSILEIEKARLEDAQKRHESTQATIRSGDNALDRYVRRTRPRMARQSWGFTLAYCLGCVIHKAVTGDDLFNTYIASIITAPAWGYIGFRTFDKFAQRSNGALPHHLTTIK